MAEGREYPERPVVAVGGVVISEARALLIRRGQPPLEGRWSIPGGILELGETIAEGIARELFEETGLRVHALDLLDVYEKLLRDAGDRARYHFVILDYLCELQEGTARAGSDVTEVAWVREEDLKQFQLTGAAARVVRKAFAMARERSEAAHH
jgi:ADP-ribose pyrophosphatase YjhB (NUDIX family)